MTSGSPSISSLSNTYCSVSLTSLNLISSAPSITNTSPLASVKYLSHIFLRTVYPPTSQKMNSPLCLSSFAIFKPIVDVILASGIDFCPCIALIYSNIVYLDYTIHCCGFTVLPEPSRPNIRIL